MHGLNPGYAFVFQETYHILLSSIAMIHLSISDYAKFPAISKAGRNQRPGKKDKRRAR